MKNILHSKSQKMMIYIIIGLCIVVGIFIQLKAKNKETQTNKNTKVHKTQENAYEGLRKMAFEVSSEQLGLTLSKDKTKVYGVVLDWEIEGATITLVSYQTGDASLYLSTGGGVIGGGQHENVKIASKNYISLAQERIKNSEVTEETNLPKTNEIYFYFLTNKGKFIAKDKMENIENKSSKWLELFEEANKVISELRLTTENK